MNVDVLKSSTQLGTIKFTFQRNLMGPFHSRAYMAALCIDGEIAEEKQVYPDYFCPLGNAIERFDLGPGYRIFFDDYLKARRSIVDGKNFEVELQQDAIVKES